MKIADSEAIKSGERELIDAITADLDWSSIEEIFRKQHNLGIEDDVEFKNGDIVVLDDQIAYRLEFEAKVTLSILFDREGNYISLESTGDLDKTSEENEEKLQKKTEDLADDSNEQSDYNAAQRADREQDPQTSHEPEAQLAHDDVTKPEGGPEAALTEPEHGDILKNSEMALSMPSDATPQEKISQMASQVAEMISEVDEKK
ncbi:MAG: hypothetical protein DRH17_01625 [Deltaproteobacteria bacterium]|nr:MAG: hypothetical protein DRH17_01625 [Deltaproteobacteria bacterium]